MIAKNFLICGLTGWCMEILFTSADCIRKKDRRMIGQTSLWMFPIYGMGAFLVPLSTLIKKWHIALRGLVYATLIFMVEFLSGRLLWEKNACPWDYSRSKWNISKVIRLDFTPYWIGVGLLFEKLGQKLN